MTERVRAVLDSLSEDERQELFTALLREHFAGGERETEVRDAEGALVGFLTSPGVHSCHLLGLDPRDMPPELAGPYFPAGTAIAKAQRMEAEASARSADARR
jgi:hypothetical protein